MLKTINKIIIYQDVINFPDTKVKSYPKFSYINNK